MSLHAHSDPVCLLDPHYSPRVGRQGLGSREPPQDTQGGWGSARVRPASCCQLLPSSGVFAEQPRPRQIEFGGSEPPDTPPPRAPSPGPGAQGSQRPHLSLLSHGCWKQGGCSPCTTRASNRNLGAQKPTAPVTKAMAVTPRVDHTKLQLQEKAPWLKQGEGQGAGGVRFCCSPSPIVWALRWTQVGSASYPAPPKRPVKGPAENWRH